MGHDAGFSWSHWTFHPSTIAGVLALALTYAWLLGPLARRRGERSPPRWRVVVFAAGLAVILLSLNGPLHDLSEHYLFTAHMVQHLLLTLVVPPLLLAGLPGWVPDLALEARPVRAVARLLTTPLVAFLFPNFVLGVWHFPAPYDAALASHPLHIVMHLSLMVSATILWWPVLSSSTRLPRLHPAGQLIYLFCLGLPMSLIGALIALAEEPIYQGYVNAPRLYGLSPVEDQHLGGLIMWVPGMLVFWGWMTVVWFRWFNAEEREDALARAQRAAAPGVAPGAPR